MGKVPWPGVVTYQLRLVIDLLRATIWLCLILWRGLLALAAQDLGVYLICAGIEQVDCPILQRPEVAIQCQVVIGLADALARNRLRGF
jgi:hypothetical protein